FQVGGGRIPVGFREGARTRIEQGGGRRIDHGQNRFAGFDVGAGLERDPPQLSRDRRGNYVTIFDARFAFFIDRDTQVAFGDAGGLDRNWLRKETDDDEHKQHHAAGPGKPAASPTPAGPRRGG